MAYISVVNPKLEDSLHFFKQKATGDIVVKSYDGLYIKLNDGLYVNKSSVEPLPLGATIKIEVTE